MGISADRINSRLNVVKKDIKISLLNQIKEKENKNNIIKISNSWHGINKHLNSSMGNNITVPLNQMIEDSGLEDNVRDIVVEIENTKSTSSKCEVKIDLNINDSRVVVKSTIQHGTRECIIKSFLEGMTFEQINVYNAKVDKVIDSVNKTKEVVNNTINADIFHDLINSKNDFNINSEIVDKTINNYYNIKVGDIININSADRIDLKYPAKKEEYKKWVMNNDNIKGTQIKIKIVNIFETLINVDVLFYKNGEMIENYKCISIGLESFYFNTLIPNINELVDSYYKNVLRDKIGL